MLQICTHIDFACALRTRTFFVGKRLSNASESNATVTKTLLCSRLPNQAQCYAFVDNSALAHDDETCFGPIKRFNYAPDWRSES